MFTGIVRQIGTVTGVRQGASSSRLAIDLGSLAEGLCEGDSVAVDGACLTAVKIEGTVAEFDVVGQTLANSTLGGLAKGDKVNLERSLRAGLDRIEGHMVAGHVDGSAEVTDLRRGDNYVIKFRTDKAITDQMVPRGSVAVNGVSLTLAEVGDGRFATALIPTTLDDSTLGQLRPGDKVNVETDIIGKYIRKYLDDITGENAGVTMQKLKETGFV